MAEKRAKVALAEEVVNLSQTMSFLIEKASSLYEGIASGKVTSQALPQHRVNEFLISHYEFKYYHLIQVLERLIDSYYTKGAIKEIKFLTELHAQLTNRDNIRISFKHNAFHVSAANTRPELISLDSVNLQGVGYYNNHIEEVGYQSCLQPTINEKALNPPQITLLEGMYGHSTSVMTQYAGQIPHTVFPTFETAFINLSESERQYINSTLHSVKIIAKDYLEVIHREKLTSDSFEEGATIDQLRKSSRFLTDLIKARQLKTALMCWLSNSTLPMDPQSYN